MDWLKAFYGTIPSPALRTLLDVAPCVDVSCLELCALGAYLDVVMPDI